MNRLIIQIACVGVMTLTCTAMCQTPPASDSGVEARKQLRDELQQREQDTFTKLQLSELSTRCKATLDVLEKLAQASADLQKRSKDLLVSDDGKKVASSDDALKAFVEYQDKPFFNAADLDQRVASTKALLADLTKAQNEPAVGYVPDVQRKLETDASYAWANDKLSKLNEFSDLLSTIVKTSPPTASSTKTLGDVVEAYKAKRLADFYAARRAGEDAAKGEKKQITIEAAKAAEIEKATAQAQADLKNAREEIERLKADQERQLQELRLANQEAAVKAQIAAEQKQVELQSELDAARLSMKQKQASDQIANAKQDENIDKQKMVAQCQSKEIQDLLRPFTTPGRWNPPNKFGVTKHPMSLSALESFGALKDTDEGLVRLADCCNKMVRYEGSNFYSRDDDRPKIGITSDVLKWTDGDTARLKKIQSTLNELGPTLVALKMLDP